MKKLFSAMLIGSSLLSAFAQAQIASKCGTYQLLEQKFQANPVLKNDYIEHRQLKSLASLNSASSYQKTTATKYTIPVIFHVILTQAKINQLGGTTGIRDRMISQLDALNKDYSATNADSSQIPVVFKPLFGNATIEFQPAHKSPTNSSVDGYEILVTTKANFSSVTNDGCDCKDASLGGINAWDPNKYLNIWVIDIKEAGILGYTVPPSFVNWGWSANMTGVVIDYGNFGKRTSATQFFNPSVTDLGRTLTHEIGHFFELEHTFGQDATCSGIGDDGISDTPPQSEPTYNSTSACPSFPLFDVCSSSGNGIMWMNYMDYVDDKCMVMFTKGQVNLMRSQFNVPGITKSLSETTDVLYWPTNVTTTNNTPLFQVYPNPSNSIIQIQSNNSQLLSKIIVFNSLGQTVKTINTDNNSINSFTVDLSGMPKGLYLVQCTFDQQIATQKITIE